LNLQSQLNKINHSGLSRGEGGGPDRIKSDI